VRAQKASPSDSGESPEIPPLLPYEPPRDDQIIVWKEEEGKPFVFAIFDEIFCSTEDMEHDTYRDFVQKVGPVFAEVAIRLYRMTEEESTD
jgi:hypothetical protein